MSMGSSRLSHRCTEGGRVCIFDRLSYSKDVIIAGRTAGFGFEPHHHPTSLHVLFVGVCLCVFTFKHFQRNVFKLCKQPARNKETCQLIRGKSIKLPEITWWGDNIGHHLLILKGKKSLEGSTPGKKETQPLIQSTSVFSPPIVLAQKLEVILV